MADNADRDHNLEDLADQGPLSGLQRVDSRVVPGPRPPQTGTRARVSGVVPAGDWSDEDQRAHRAVVELTRCNPSEAEAVADRVLRLGQTALPLLEARFPGPLWVSRAQVQEQIPAAEDISAIAYTLVRFGLDAIPVLVDLLSNPRRDVRYFAALMCRDLAHGRLVAPLAAVALEDDRECRRVGIHVLSSYRGTTAYRAATLRFRRLCADTQVPSDLRKRAISVLTQLRETGCVPLFVDLLASAEPTVKKAARIALRVLTAHDFGLDRAPWLQWLQKNGNERRPGWLIEGLADHRSEVRLLAASELWRATRMFPPPSPGHASAAFYRKLQHEYRTWWTQDGRHAHTS